jgi:hypothetical protein
MNTQATSAGQVLAGVQLDQGQRNIDVHLEGNEAVMEFNWDLKYIVFKFSMAYAV